MEKDVTIEGARELCGVATAGQLGFLQPLAKTFKSYECRQKHRGADGSSGRRTAENRGWATDIVTFGRKMIKTIHKRRLPTGERVC